MVKGTRKLPNEEGEYECIVCHEWKPLWEYHKDNNRANGRRSVCKVCHTRINRNYKLSIRYGISTEEFENKLEAQNSQCACCEDELMVEGKKSRNPCVDHNHKTNEIRDILCVRCNLALGYLKDSSLRALKVLKYLIKWDC